MGKALAIWFTAPTVILTCNEMRAVIERLLPRGYSPLCHRPIAGLAFYSFGHKFVVHKLTGASLDVRPQGEQRSSPE